MNARFLRVAKLNGHHNRAQAGGWGLWQAARAGEREAWEAITQKNYSHSAWKASLRCLRRLMVVVPKKRTMCDWCGGGGRWGELGGEGGAGGGGGGGGGGGAEVMEVQGNQSNHSLTPAPPQNPNFKWIEMKGHLLIIRSHQGKCEELEETKQSWQNWLLASQLSHLRADIGRGLGEGWGFQNIFAPRLKTFLFQSPDFRLIKLVIVLLSDYSNTHHSLLRESQNFYEINFPCFSFSFWHIC